MNDVLQIVENEQSSEFYPTPQSLVEKMCECVNWDKVHTVLEPSAGRGDILRAVAKKQYRFGRRYGVCEFDVDCIEIDPNLRQVLKYQFSDERRKQLEQEDEEQERFFKNGIHIVHDNFLTYTPFKSYDLIIMNPPFSNGDKHLLKALEMQKNGGSVVCLLNAETIRNPYTETRKALVERLKENDAKIEFIENAFASADRKTGVEVALISVTFEQVEEESDIYEHFRKAAEVEDFNPEVTDLEVSDYIKAAVGRFNVEARAGLELIRQYRAMIPYMSKGFGDNSFDKSPILRLTDSSDRGYNSVSSNEYLKKVRLKYWEALLSNPKFTNRLTSKLQEKYRKRVNELAYYDFSEFNIYTLSAEMGEHIKTGVESEIVQMFDTLTEEHSWFPEMQKNRHYYDGWATNKAHKIGKKVIIPCYGIVDEWDGKPRVYNARGKLEDIERVLNFLDGRVASEVDFWGNLEAEFKQGNTKNIELKYFTATFYKKGTIHLVFNCPELIERFNIYAAQHKNWLPPSYGKKKYADMTEQEKVVVDSFQGEEAYNEVMAKANFYLAPVSDNRMLMLGGA